MRELYRRPTLPLLSISFTDDEYMSKNNVDTLHGFYVHARREMRRIAPAELAVARIGHFGYFRADLGARLWPAMMDWISRSISADRASTSSGA